MGQCSRCARKWTGDSTCHCGGSAVFAFPLWDCDALLAANRHPRSHKPTPDDGRVEPQNASDLLGAEARLVEPGSFVHVESAVATGVLVGHEWHEVRWGVVGLDVVEVVNVCRVPDCYTGNNSVLIALDVLTARQTPAETDVAGAAQVTTRFVVGNRLSGPQVPTLGPLHPDASRTAGITSPSLLGRIPNLYSALNADNGGHTPILVATASCHRTFTSLSAFDAHQTLVRGKTGVHCSDPAGTYRKSGAPVFGWNATREMWALWSPPDRVWAPVTAESKPGDTSE